MTTTQSAETGTFREPFTPGWIATSLVLARGTGLHAINIFLTTSLLPTATDDIGGEHLYAWSTTVFVVASVISSMVVSRLLAGRGTVSAYLAGLLPFAVGTVVATLSPTMVWMLVGRGIQGFGGGLLAALGYAVVQSAFPSRLWAKATALVSAMWGLGTLAGPAVGGAFAQVGAWRWAFGVLDEPSRILVLVVIALAVIAGFIRWERRAYARVLPARTYASRSPLAWIYLTIAILAVGTVSEAFAPLFGQRLAGLEPLLAGFLGAAVSLGWSVTMLVSSSATDPATIRRLRVAGPGVLAAGLALAGALVNLGAPSMVRSAQLLLFGLAALAAAGTFVSRRG